MNSFLASSVQFLRQVYALARPYGRAKLLWLSLISLLQGLFQVIGVTSIFPFLALAADPGRLRSSRFGRMFLEALPPMTDSQLLFFSGLFAIAMLFLSNGLNLLGEFVRNRYAANFGHWLRLKLLSEIATRPYGDFLQLNSGVLMKKVVTDVANYVAAVLMPLLDVVSKVTTILFLAVALFFVHPQIAIGAVVVLGAFYMTVFRGFGRWRKAAAAKRLETGRAMYIESYQLFAGIKPVKVHRAEAAFLDRFAANSAEAARLTARVPLLANAPRYLVEPIAFGALVAMVLVYAARGQDFVAFLPNLGVMALAGYRLLPAFQMLYTQFTVLSTSRHSLDEVYQEFLEIEGSEDRNAAVAGGRLAIPAPLAWYREISIEDVGFAYPGGRGPVLEHLTLKIPKNSSLGIIGETGAGKSTLVDLILGLHSPTQGRILVDEAVLGPENRRAWQGGIGYVPQEIFLIDDSVEANIAFGVPRKSIDHARVREVCAAAQLLEFIENELPMKFATIVGERGVRLSGGQKQRIGLARALYHRPELLVLDEATSALDTETEAEVMQAIKALRGKITMIIIAHRLTTVQGCDRLLDLTPKRPVGTAGEPVVPASVVAPSS